MDMTGQMILLLLACAPPILGISREYHFVELHKTFSEAQSYCREKFADLATIETVEDEEMAKVVLANSGYARAWIGLYADVNTWRWSWDNTYLNSTLESWFSFARDNAKNAETCGFMYYGTVYDHECSSLKTSVCYDEPSNTYIGVHEQTTWFAAQSYCRETYTDLASMRSQQDKQAIVSVAGGQSAWIGAWIGIFRDGWKWSDQTNVSFTVWYPGEPHGGTDLCVVNHQGGWGDTSCTATFPFICSAPMKKVLKVVLKTDALMDPNDILTQESLLKQTKEQMRHQGIHRNFTLVWRKQVNGKVFNRSATGNTEIMNGL